MKLKIGWGHGAGEVVELERRDGTPIRFQNTGIEVTEANGALFVRTLAGAAVIRMTASNAAVIRWEELTEFGEATDPARDRGKDEDKPGPPQPQRPDEDEIRARIRELEQPVKGRPTRAGLAARYARARALRWVLGIEDGEELDG